MADSSEIPEGFDPAYYLEMNPDVAAAKQDPLTHYLMYGRFEQRMFRREPGSEVRYSSKHAAVLHDAPIADIDRDREFLEILRQARPYTMTPKPRVYALVEACRYVNRASIPGDFVECGVWRGGSCIAAGLALRATSSGIARKLYLYDTFTGMSPPTDIDVDANGNAAASLIATYGDDGRWCYAYEDEVRQNLLQANIPPSDCVFTAGDVLETIPTVAPAQIAVCRLDTDWYESTAHELKHLYPRIAPGGVLILDDYGDWNGARAAVDEFLADHSELMLVRVDESARLIVKPV